MDKNNPDQYQTVGNKENISDIKIKGSRFISTIVHTGNRQTAENFYQLIKKKYHDATHNCLAYRISDNEFRYSDDGEPSGTAGLPIYKVLKNENIFEALIVVTRYFGGTKLGTGGLSRAYSEAAMTGLQKCNKRIKTKYITIGLETTYERYNDLLRLVNRYNGNFVNSDYKDKIALKLQIPQSRFNSFQQEFERHFYNARAANREARSEKRRA